MKNIGLIAVVALVYLIAARLSLFLAFEKTNASPVWPPSGIAFAALVLWGPRVWPGVWIGAFAANLLTFHSNFQSVSPTLFLVSIGIAAGNSLEGLAGYFLLRHWVKGSPLQKGQNGLKFVALAPMMSLVSALIGTASLVAGGVIPWEMSGKILFTWWIGDTTGVVVFTPILLAARNDLNLPRTLGRSAEAACLLLIILLVSKGVFGGWWHFAGIQPIAYALTPFLLMVAFRSGATIALLGMILVSVLAILGTVNGMGPFSTSSTNDKLLLLQAFIGVISVTLLILSASLVERSQSNRELKEANESLETRVAERTRDLEAKAAELNAKNSELEAFMQAAVGREMRIIELKGHVNGLLADQGKPPEFEMGTLRNDG